MNLNRPSFPIVSALSFSFLLLTAGCNKSSNNPPTNGTLSASAGGTTFNAAQVGSAYSQMLDLVAVLGQTIQSNDTTGFLIEFPYPPPVGVAFSSDSTAAGISYFIPGKRYDALMGQGKVVLTISLMDTVNLKLAGTFSGTVYNDANLNDSVIITNGKFSSTYSVQP